MTSPGRYSNREIPNRFRFDRSSPCLMRKTPTHLAHGLSNVELTIFGFKFKMEKIFRNATLKPTPRYRYMGSFEGLHSPIQTGGMHRGTRIVVGRLRSMKPSGARNQKGGPSLGEDRATGAKSWVPEDSENSSRVKALKMSQINKE